MFVKLRLKVGARELLMLHADTVSSQRRTQGSVSSSFQIDTMQLKVTLKVNYCKTKLKLIIKIETKKLKKDINLPC